jgi:hypothetical protein
VKIPSSPFTNNLAVTYPSFATDTRLTVRYDISTSSTSIIRPTWITSYVDTTQTATIYETNSALEANYTLYVWAWFNYDPSS